MKLTFFANLFCIRNKKIPVGLLFWKGKFILGGQSLCHFTDSLISRWFKCNSVWLSLVYFRIPFFLFHFYRKFFSFFKISELALKDWLILQIYELNFFSKRFQYNILFNFRLNLNFTQNAKVGNFLDFWKCENY